jgi:YrbI family 3-deoxy-D-manno-octulosonate 8-phosphate phosphatase
MANIAEYLVKYPLLARLLNREAEWTIAVKSLDLVVYDFDGVMTDNRVLVLQDGTEGVMANRADGLGVERVGALGLPQMILSTETNDVVKARARKLKLEIITGCRDKKTALQDYCRERGHDLRRVLFVGNDVNDLPVMQVVGFPIAPADGHPAVKQIAFAVTRAKGGEGVVKELSERLVAG